MLNLFPKKELKCEVCLRPLKDGKYHRFGSSDIPEYKNLKELKLCTLCLVEKYKEYLNRFQHKAIIIEPFDLKRRFNAYDFYTFDVMAKGWDKENVEEVKKLIPETGQCIKCGRPSSFLWCSPEIYYGDPYTFRINHEYKGNLMCVDCISSKLSEIFHQEHRFFDRVLPPLEGDGVATCSDC